MHVWRPKLIRDFPSGCLPVLYGLESWRDIACIYQAWSRRPFTIKFKLGTEVEIPHDQKPVLVDLAQRSGFGFVKSNQPRRATKYVKKLAGPNPRTVQIRDKSNRVLVKNGDPYFCGDTCMILGVVPDTALKLWVIDLGAINGTSAPVDANVICSRPHDFYLSTNNLIAWDFNETIFASASAILPLETTNNVQLRLYCIRTKQSIGQNVMLIDHGELVEILLTRTNLLCFEGVKELFTRIHIFQFQDAQHIQSIEMTRNDIHCQFSGYDARESVDGSLMDVMRATDNGKRWTAHVICVLNPFNRHCLRYQEQSWGAFRHIRSLVAPHYQVDEFGARTGGPVVGKVCMDHGDGLTELSSPLPSRRINW
ncbi:hypothetical protein HK097_008111 [Rhizophlyctis rosea]|uniref:Uncharacterized protein n=1 Tax=Rhizophlyctis rosea TaxID=64517 RepID=A0AAD5SAQ5_9FUNG|nr:hypothetical protein HK097_008111 [Rhizophlyctis rosea]